MAKLHIIFTFLFFLGALSNNQAKTIQAKSGSSSDIQAAVNSAGSGDVIQLPPGSFSLNGIEILIPANINSLTIQGSKQNRTVLKGLFVHRENNGQIILAKQKGTTEPSLIISDLTFDGGEKLRVKNIIDFRVTNCIFKNQKYGISLIGNSRGVVDHCRFIDVTTYPVSVTGDGEEGWNRPFELGTENAVFVEDCYFEGCTWVSIASNNGSRYVFRYNEILIDVRQRASTVDAHGWASWPRGSRSYEVYNNYVNSVAGAWDAVNPNGGDGLIFNNTFVGNFERVIVLGNAHQPPNGQGCNCSYPCKDQIRECYIWNNTYNGGAAPLLVGCPSLIQKDRDYFLYKRPDYTPYPYPHPFVGGSGNLSLRISTVAVSRAVVGKPYLFDFTASWGETPYTWAVVSGSLPASITLSAAGTLSGTTNSEGDYAFTIQVLDAKGDTAAKAFTLGVSSNIFSPVSYFGDANNWQPDQANLWAVSEQDGDKRYIITQGNLNRVNSKLATYSLVNGKTYADFVMTMKVKSPVDLANNNADFDLVFGYLDDDNYYYVMFSSNAAWSALHKIENGSRLELQNANASLINDNAYHLIEVSRSGNQITVNRDGQVVLTASDGTFGEGQLGIGTFNDVAYFDDIEVTAGAVGHPSTPPRHGSGQALGIQH